MKKLNIAIALALGLLVPSVAMAASDVDITIRLMEIHENSTVEVMNRLKLPEMSAGNATEEANVQKRFNKRIGITDGKSKYYAGDGPGDSEISGDGNTFGSGKMERHQISDIEPEFDNESPMEQEQNEIENELNDSDQGNEPPDENQPGPGLGG